MSASLYLQTRSRTDDYRFVGPQPSSGWWSAFSETKLERPSLIVISRKGKDWKCLLSGIPSVRRDRVGTVIRYTLVIEGNSTGGTGAETFIGRWLDDLARNFVDGTLQSVLDEQFDEETVERITAIEAAGEDAVEEVSRLLSIVSERLAELAGSAVTHSPSSTPQNWLGSTSSSTAIAALRARIRELLAGHQVGCAGVLNLVSSPDEVRAIAEREGSAAVLTLDRQKTMGDRIIDVSAEKKTSRNPQAEREPANLLQLLIQWIISLLKTLLRGKR